MEALEDFDVAQRVRPKIVKDTGEFYCVLGIVQAETGRYSKFYPHIRPFLIHLLGPLLIVLEIQIADITFSRPLSLAEAMRSFDYAMALKPQERDNYLAKRAQYNL